MRKFITLIIVTGVILSLAGCGGKPVNDPKEDVAKKETIKIAYLPITHAIPLFIESELQNSTKDGLSIELVKFGSWPELLDALNTGRVDGASVLIELAMKSKAQGIGLTAVALGHTDGNVIISSKNINDPSDLKGKTIAIPHRQSSHYLLISQMLKDAGLTIDDVNIVELSPPEMPSALAAGKIEGYCVAEPFGAKAVALDAGKVLYESGDLWDHSLCCALVLNDNFIKGNEDLVKQFVAEYKNAGEYITQNKDNVYDLANKYLNVDKEVFDISMNWISFEDLSITEEGYADLVKRVKQLNLLDNPPSYENFVNSDLY